MFEIRIICTPDDTDRITTTLAAAFTTGAVRRHPTRDGERTRLYLTADHKDTPETPTAQWPTPEQAYAGAPSIISEIGWVARTVAARECFTKLDREFYLRKAALLDRIALLDEPETPGDTTETANAAAVYLLDLDQPGAVCNPRGYVRQQYTRWTTDHQ
ncbi:hypothetical protein [Streptomyces sp. NPDC059176]|uniref:hypothetical protein n=1 Tax=Streptomyces sp. NPDC059176 TaxID=3346758 RepID=UPI0036B44E7A